MARSKWWPRSSRKPSVTYDAGFPQINLGDGLFLAIIPRYKLRYPAEPLDKLVQYMIDSAKQKLAKDADEPRTSEYYASRAFEDAFNLTGAISDRLRWNDAMKFLDALRAIGVEVDAECRKLMREHLDKLTMLVELYEKEERQVGNYQTVQTGYEHDWCGFIEIALRDHTQPHVVAHLNALRRGEAPPELPFAPERPEGE